MIYVATWGHLVKIGSSYDPPGRMRHLPYGSIQNPRLLPARPSLVGYVQGDIHGERLLHAALAEHRVVGEWFDGSAPAVAAVVAEAARHPTGPPARRADRRTLARPRPRGYKLPPRTHAADF